MAVHSYRNHRAHENSMHLNELNQLDQNAFVDAVGWVFEHSSWVAERAWHRRPFPDRPALHQAMVEEVEHARADEQLALLRAHPDLGIRAKLSGASEREQQGAGLADLDPHEFGQFRSLNESYKEKFGFPFLYAVKGSTKAGIRSALEQRLLRSRDDEYPEALRQVYRIAQSRLEGCVEEN